MILFNEQDILEQIDNSRLLREDGESNLLSYSNDQGTFKSKPTFVDKAMDFVSGIPEAVGVGIPKGIPVGASKFGIELMDTFTNGAYSKNFLPWLNENVPGLQELDHAINKVLKPEGTAQEIGSMIGDPIGQVVVPGALFTKAGQALNVGSKFLTNVLGYGTAEVVGINPKDNGLLELGIGLMVKNDDLKQAMIESFKADEDASVLMQKLQKAPQRFFEGGIIGEGISKAIEGVGTLYRYAKNSKTLEKIGNKAQQELDLQGGGQTLSMLGGGEIEKGVNTQLAKLAKNTEQTQKDVDYLGFYSKALEESKNLKQEKGTGEQFKAMLLKAGVKQDEIEWTGLDELLAKDKVTKKEITDLLEANKIKLDEVEKIGSEDDAFLDFGVSEDNVRLDDLYLADVAKGNDVPDKKLLKSTLTAEESYGPEYLNNRADEIFEEFDEPGTKGFTIDDAYNEAVREYYDNPIRIYEATNGYVITGNDDVGYQIFRNKAESSSWKNALNRDTERRGNDIPYSLDEAKVQAQNIAEEQGHILFESDTAKYADYTLPGGDNYREFLLTFDDKPAKMDADFIDGGHFDEENIVAHIRVKDRKLGDKKVLYIEEIQSDWGQQGRKQGFKPTKEELQNIQKQIDELNINGRKTLNKYMYVTDGSEGRTKANLKIPFGDYYLDKIEKQPPTKKTFSDLVNLFGNAKASGRIYKNGKQLDASSDAKDAISIMQKISNLEYDKYNSIPKAPFVTDTDKWTTLAIKRILAKASKEGYDAVAITPGSVHVDRWKQPGLKDFYDNIIPKIAKKIVGKLNGKITRLPRAEDTDLRDTASGDTFYNMEAFDGALLIDLTPDLKSKTKKGQALFAVPLGASALGVNKEQASTKGDVNGST